MTKGSIFRPATAEDVLYFYGTPNKKSIKAWVLEYNGERVGMGGVILEAMKYTAFLNIKGAAPKREIYKGLKLGMAELDKLNIPVVAIRDTKLESSERLLKKLKFEYYNLIDNDEVYLRCH